MDNMQLMPRGTASSNYRETHLTPSQQLIFDATVHHIPQSQSRVMQSHTHAHFGATPMNVAQLQQLPPAPVYNPGNQSQFTYPSGAVQMATAMPSNAPMPAYPIPLQPHNLTGRVSKKDP